jgi:hypothetical protein
MAELAPAVCHTLAAGGVALRNLLAGKAVRQHSTGIYEQQQQRDKKQKNNKHSTEVMRCRLLHVQNHRQPLATSMTYCAGAQSAAAAKRTRRCRDEKSEAQLLQQAAC